MQTANPLTRITEGMKVYDRLHHEIGKVDRVQIGDDDPTTLEVEAAAPADLRTRDESILDSVAEVFAPDDDIPEEIRERLLQQGFIRIDSSGLFSADRYVLPDQIMSVSGDAVTLNVSKDELIKEH